ncbi:S1C family serine protease [Fundidesulfovibrio agrisoli]|uniref:S1C family serine protease n=1 Tax=Fundidesulfovibrio agrisoli TaxID=2922717 RepID=UPI001FAC72BF|nr:S1C family serine protease [Fundidesulfovibrio agrisoli]
MRQLKYFAFAVIACCLSACVSSQTASVKDHPVIEVPDGRETKTIGLGRVVVKLPRGQVYGDLKSGALCLPNTQLVWGAGSRSPKVEEFTSIFYEELRRNNYNVKGDPTDLFNREAPATEITVGGLITDLYVEACFPWFGWGNVRKGTSKATVSVEWQVYSNYQKKVLMKSTASGEAEFKFENGNFNEALFLAFSSAVQGLLADPKFNKLLLEPEKNAEAPDPAVQAAPPAGIKVSANPKQTYSLEEVKKRVVVLQMGGMHGSGVLVGDEGYILTNDHVVKGLKRMKVIFENGTATEGIVIRSDPVQDVGLVKIENPPVKGLAVRPERVATGTEVFAVGAPLDVTFHGTVTKGIISAYRPREDGSQWIQSDAMINGGNSGGPLVDGQGRVVGLTSWKRIDTNSNNRSTGLNFFVPIAEGMRVVGVEAK